MDCFDLCRFLVTVDDNRIVNFQADVHHPVTRGFVCQKGRALVKRMLHPDRIRNPLMKKGNGFVPISQEHALELIAEKLVSIKEKFGTRAILNYTSGGYGGVKSRIQNIFFNCLGGVSEPEGSLCWGAGMAAQTYDFGSPKGHFPHDVLNADLILVWGRNPKHTSIHLYTLLKQAQKNGSRILVIDPVKTATAKAFDEYIRINPSTDGALALAMSRVIIDHDLQDKKFIERHVVGFNRFKASLADFSLEWAQKVTGIPAEIIEELALAYVRSDAAAIYIGYGMQRYHNSGNAVRSIDALAAISGKIGKKGCGANYAAQSIGPYLYDLDQASRAYAHNKRGFIVGKLGEFLERAQDPPIKAVFVSGGNPLTQSPDLEKTVEQFSRIEFKVVFDHFMTDTARHADLVLPAASVFEQEDVFATSMYSPVLNFSQKAVEPPNGVVPEFDFYLNLARKLGITTLGFKDSDEYLQKSVQPLLDKLGIRSSRLWDEYLRIESDEIAWEDKKFATPSGKIELYSKTAEAAGLSPLPVFIPARKGTGHLPLRLLTCHTKESMHSQGFVFRDDLPTVYVNPRTAKKFDVQDGSFVYVNGARAQIRAALCVDDAVCDGTAFIYQGFRHTSGAVNFLTDSVISDMGRQAAFYDSFCTLEHIG